MKYDAAGRMVKEGAKAYAYGWLDKVMSVRRTANVPLQANGSGKDKLINTYTYSMNGQIASANIKGKTENFVWDGLALLKRGTTEYVYEPAVTGGNPILANGKGLFNDMLGNSLGVTEKDKFTSIKRDAFGKTLENPAGNAYNMFTGKPQIGGLGYAFLFRNYRPGLGKWQTQDPIAIVMAFSDSKNMHLHSRFMASLGYPDGWNNLAYGNNAVTSGVDYQGTVWVEKTASKTIAQSVSTFYQQPSDALLQTIRDSLKIPQNDAAAQAFINSFTNVVSSFTTISSAVQYLGAGVWKVTATYTAIVTYKIEE